MVRPSGLALQTHDASTSSRALASLRSRVLKPSVSELRPGAKQRSLHAVLVESLTNTKALLTRLEAGVQCAALERGVVCELYVQTRRQLKALSETLELQGLE